MWSSPGLPESSDHRSLCQGGPCTFKTTPMHNRNISTRSAHSTRGTLAATRARLAAPQRTCDVDVSAAPRAHRGETGRPRVRSRSPCRRNSFMSRSAQRRAVAKGRHVLEMSAAWTMWAQSWSRAAGSAAHAAGDGPCASTVAWPWCARYAFSRPAEKIARYLQSAGKEDN